MQNMEYWCRRFCEIYNERVSTWVPLAESGEKVRKERDKA